MLSHYKRKWNKDIVKQCKSIIYKVYFKHILMPKEKYKIMQNKIVQPGIGRQQKDFEGFSPSICIKWKRC
jgi:hypothetical protein